MGTSVRGLVPAFLIVSVMMGGAGRASEIIGAADVACVDGAHEVTVAGSWYNMIAGEYEHILLERQTVGVCEPDVFLDDAPLPINPTFHVGYASFTATVTVTPPRGDVVYRYVPYAVRPDGSRSLLLHNCDADMRGYALAACDAAPFLRGRVVVEPASGNRLTYRIAACEADCWTEPHDELFSEDAFTALAGEPAAGLVGQVVDAYGDRTYCGLPGDSGHVLTRIARTVGGACGPVPAEAVGWGAVKAMYR